MRKLETVRIPTAAIVAFLILTATSCYNRAELPVKTTPPAATVYVHFDVSEDLQDTQGGYGVVDQAQAVAEEAKAALTSFQGNPMAEIATSMTSQMKGDLVRSRLAFPIVDEDKPTDLRLTGTFRADPYGVALDWQVVEVASGAVIAANTITNALFTGNVEPFSDEILAELLGLDMDRYASGAGPKITAPTPPGPAVAGEAPASDTDGSANWAVVIGIEKYRDDLPEATWAEADAKAFESYAEGTLGIPPTHIKTLLGARAGRADMASAFEEWLPRNAVDRKAVVYVFFSGHGAPDPASGAAYLVPYDADAAYLKTRGYAVTELYKQLDRLKVAQTVVFLDSCFSGSGDRSVLAAGTRPLVPVRDTATPKGVVAFSAASAAQTTGAAQGQQHGLFTFHLLAALAGAADTNGDHNVSLDEVVKYVSGRVAEDARLDNREQTPTLKAPRGLRPSSVVLVNHLQAP